MSRSILFCALAALGLAVAAAAVGAATGCSSAAQHTEQTILTDGKIACATLLADHPSADVARICNLEAPTAALVQSGVQMANDVRDGGAVGAPEVAGAVEAILAEAQAAKALTKPPDAGGAP